MPIFHRLLLAFLVVGALIAAPLIYVALQFSQDAARVRTEQSIQQQIAIIAGNFEQEFGVGLQRSLKQIAASEALQQYLTASRDERLVNARVLETSLLRFQTDYETYSGLYFVDAQGQMVASVEDGKRVTWAAADTTAAPAKATASTPTRLKALFARIKTAPALLSSGNMEWFMPPREAVIEGPYVDEKGRVSLLAGLTSLDFDNGAFSGTVVIRVRLDAFISTLGSITLFDEKPVWLFARSGEVWLKPESPSMPVALKDLGEVEASGEAMVLRRDEGFLAHRDLSVLGGSPILRLAYAVPNELLRRDFQPALIFFLVVLGISAGVVLTLAYLLARNFSAPIIQLAKAAAGMAAGDLAQKVEVKSSGEIAVLVSSFNQMSLNLESANRNRANAFAVLRQTAARMRTQDVGARPLPAEGEHDDGAALPPGQEDAEDLRAISVLIGQLIDERQQNLRGLREAKERAERADQAKSQFLANVSHEIRTPLNAVLGMLKLLQSTALTARQSDYVNKTEGAARSLLLLLNDVLDFSKAEADKMHLDPRPFRLDQLMRDLSVILAASVGSKPVEVLFDIDPRLPQGLVGDDLRLQQVLINLGGNAVKFTESGEVVVGVRALEVTQEDALVEFSVRDTGIGIEKSQQAHIFSGFSQAEASTTRRFGGTGLGLAICQKLVSLMGGSIELESEPGRGSLFRFSARMPLAPPTEELASSSQLETLATDTSFSVLVVDDNDTAREVLADMARSLGWEVDVADSGPRALEMSRARSEAGRPYDAAFVDWQMPGMDGWATSQALKQAGAGGESALVMMITAHGREMLAQRSPEEQATLGGFLVKPVTASMLRDAVADARSCQAGAPPWMEPVPASPPRRLAGLRLRVVEDNLNNQQVAKELLEAEGAVVVLAGNGAEGVEAVQRANPAFDVVLMDLQMPVMDGFTAARRIREWPEHRALPIVAMTANAMASDRQACLEAGMNEHIGKPFDLNDLVQVLRQMVGSAAPGTDTAAPLQEAPPAATLLGDPALAHAQAVGIDLALAVQRLGGRPDVYARMLGRFRRDLPETTRRFSEAVTSRQWQQAATELHTLKGLAGTLGARSLQEFLYTSEKVMAGGAVSDVQAEQLLGELLDRAARLDAGVAPLLQALDNGANASPVDVAELDRGDVRTQIEGFLDLLRSSDMGALERYERLRGGLALWPADVVSSLEEAMSSLDFEAAADRCERLLATDEP